MPQNIVLIVCDTLSAFHLPCYGHDRKTAPFLSSLAADNALFRYAYANAPWTVPSHASLFSGELPSDHGTTTKDLRFTADSFVEDLQEQGYTTYGLSNNMLIHPDLGFDAGFDYFRSHMDLYLESRQLPALQIVWRKENDGAYAGSIQKYTDLLKQAAAHRDFRSLAVEAKLALQRQLGMRSDIRDRGDDGAKETNRLAKRLLQDEDGPFFLFINYGEPHAHYTPPPWAVDDWGDHAALREDHRDVIDDSDFFELEMMDTDVSDAAVDSMRTLYDGEIRYLDTQIQELYDWITDRFDDTLFIITADHGENIGHYGQWGHQFGIYERLIRVPLIVAGPDIAPTTIDRPVALRELPDYIAGDSTLADLGSTTVQAEYQGAHHLFTSLGRDLSTYPERYQPLLRNASRCIITGNTGVITHSHLPNTTFRAHPDEFRESIAAINIDRRARTEPQSTSTKSELQEIDV